MTGLARKTMLFGVCGLLAAATALANVPDPAHSTLPKYIKVVGTNSGGVDAAGTFSIVVRDFANNPVSNSRVELNFSACCDLRLCTVVVAGQTLKQCQPPIVSAISDPTGTVTFTVIGAAVDPGTCVPPNITPGPGAGCITMTASGFPMGTATAVDLDLNGAFAAANNGHNGGDLPVLIQNIGAQGSGANYRGRGDYSGDGAVNGLDISFYIPLLGRSASGIGSGSGCPGNAYCAKPSTCPATGPCKNP